MEFLVRLCSSFIIHFIFYNYFHDKYKTKISVVKQCVLIIILVNISSFINLLGIPQLNFLIMSLCYIFMGYSIFEYHTFKEVISDLAFFILMVLLETLCFYIANILLGGIDINNNVHITLISSLILFFLSSILKGKMNGFSLKNVSIYGFIVFFSTTFFNMFLLYIFAYAHNSSESNIHREIIIFASIGTVMINIVIISCFQIINKSNQTKSELMCEKHQYDRLLQHYADIKKNIDNTQGLIHDFRNHFQTVTLAYEQGENELAKKTIDNYLNEIDKSKIIYNTNNVILDMILYEKHNEAAKYGIKFIFKMKDMDLNFIDDFELITLVGNLLDNCIEANYEVSNLEKFISILVFEVDGMIIIKIENSCNNKIDIVNNEIKTTKKSSDHKRGQGVRNIKKVVDKLEGNFDIYIKEEVCTTIISIPVLVN